MEVNVFSPGGLGSSAALYDENFAAAIIEDLERKVGIRSYHRQLRNIDLATL